MNLSGDWLFIFLLYLVCILQTYIFPAQIIETPTENPREADLSIVLYMNGEEKEWRGAPLVAFLGSTALMVLQNWYSASAIEICCKTMICMSRTAINLRAWILLRARERKKRGTIKVKKEENGTPGLCKICYGNSVFSNWKKSEDDTATTESACLKL